MRITVISPAGGKLLWCLGSGSEQGTLWQWALQGLKYHPILQCLDPPVIAYSWTHGSQTVLLLGLHSTEVAFTYLSQVEQMPRIVPSKKSGNECSSKRFIILNFQKLITVNRKITLILPLLFVFFSRLLHTRATPVCSNVFIHCHLLLQGACVTAALCCSGFCSRSKHPSQELC